MEKEYMMLRNEMDECIKRQNLIFGTIITLLGLSNAIPAFFDNISFLLFVLVLSTLLQLQVIEDRNRVYYISTYLRTVLEKKNLDFNWENRIYLFKKEMPNTKGIKKLVFKIVKAAKHLAIMSFIFFISIRLLFYYIPQSAFRFEIKIFLYIMVVVVLICNFFNVFYIIKDKKLINKYSERWVNIMQKLEKEGEDADDVRKRFESIYASTSIDFEEMMKEIEDVVKLHFKEKSYQIYKREIECHEPKREDMKEVTNK